MAPSSRAAQLAVGLPGGRRRPSSRSCAQLAGGPARGGARVAGGPARGVAPALQAAQPNDAVKRGRMLMIERWEVRSVAVWARPPKTSAGVFGQTPAPIGSRRDRRRPSSQELPPFPAWGTSPRRVVPTYGQVPYGGLDCPAPVFETGAAVNNI